MTTVELDKESIKTTIAPVNCLRLHHDAIVNLHDTIAGFMQLDLYTAYNSYDSTMTTAVQ